MFMSKFHHFPWHGGHPMVGSQSPWGTIDHVYNLLPGIVQVSTSSHGGFHLSKERLEAMPEAARSDDSWYEEDVEVGLVMLAFWDEFEPICGLTLEGVRAAVEQYHPELVEVLV